MSGPRRRGVESPASVGEQLTRAVGSLAAALDAGADFLPTDEVLAAEKVLKKADERLALTGGHTVVALAGPTGSGKSTLFNVLAGAQLSRTGALRPTTSLPTAAVWGREPATALLDWLRVTSRHHVPAGRGAATLVGGLDGLVLLDLPDIDSHRAEHRIEADRVLALADVFVWVTDPQKYADASLHETYLARAREHELVTLVVLNQADRLTEAEQHACREDLRGLLAADGLPHAEVLLLSARAGQGVPDLVAALHGAVTAATAARLRLVGDVVDAAARLRAHVADTEADLPADPSPELVDALARTAGVPVVLAGIEADHRRRALAATGWPLTRWRRALRPDPLRRLRLEAAKAPPGEATVVPEEFGPLLRRSSLPEPTPAARAGVERLTRRLATDAAAGLPAPWARAVEAAVDPTDVALADALDMAIVGAPLPARRSWWWRVVGGLQWLLAAIAVVGLGWLVALAALAALQMPVPDPPRVGLLPAPTIMLVGGLVLGAVLGVVVRPLAAAGARRARQAARAGLNEAIAQVARERLVAPLHELLARHADTRRHLEESARR